MTRSLGFIHFEETSHRTHHNWDYDALKSINMEVDTGAAITIIGRNTFN